MSEQTAPIPETQYLRPMRVRKALPVPTLIAIAKSEIERYTKAKADLEAKLESLKDPNAIANCANDIRMAEIGLEHANTKLATLQSHQEAQATK